MSDEDEIVREGNGGDHEVERADALAGAFKLRTSLGVDLDATVVKRHRREQAQEGTDLVRNARTATLQGAEEDLAAHDVRDGDGAARLGQDSARWARVSVAEGEGDGVRIEGVGGQSGSTSLAG